MNATKRILAAILAVIALGAIAFAVHLFTKDREKTKSTEFRSQVQHPSNAAPQWTMDGQKAEADYSARDSVPHNATRAVNEDNAAAEKSGQGNGTTTTVVEGPVIIQEDGTITFAFIDNLAQYVVKRFQPARDENAPFTRTSFRDLNMHFGRNLDGIDVSATEPREARAQVLDYVFTPASLKALYALYADLFVEQLGDAVNEAADKLPHPLDQADLSDMYRVNAAELSHVGKIFKAIAADPQITKQTAKYIQSLRAVERSNVLFQESLAERSPKSIQTAASDRLKNAIRERERIRKNIIDLVHANCTNCSDEDMFYISLWSYRRTLGNTNKLTSFDVAGDCLLDLASRFKKKAVQLIQIEQ